MRSVSWWAMSTLQYKNMLLAGLVCVACLGTAKIADAQVVIWGGEAERYFRPGAWTPYDGQTSMERYNYSTGTPSVYIAPGMSGSQLYSLDYADRLSRALRFGYPLPPEPSKYTPPPAHPRWGLGLGVFTWR